MELYIKEQLDVLYDFGIVVTEKITAHMRELKSEIAIENYVQSLIEHKLER